MKNKEFLKYLVINFGFIFFWSMFFAYIGDKNSFFFNLGAILLSFFSFISIIFIALSLEIGIDFSSFFGIILIVGMICNLGFFYFLLKKQYYKKNARGLQSLTIWYLIIMLFFGFINELFRFV